MDNFIRDSKNSFHNKDCVILTCGPSLNSVSKENIVNFCKNKLIIAIKQAFLIFKDITHYHLVNDVHYIDYSYDNCNACILYLNTNLVDPPIVKHDSKFILDNQEYLYEQSLAGNLHFEDWTFERAQYKRPFGPGIIYELGFFLAVHAGVKKISTIGWDIKNINQHFYENMSFYPDKRIILPGQYEEQLISNSTFKLYQWLKNSGIELEICTINSAADSRIPRNII